MNKTFTYKDGYITQKPEMEKPDGNLFSSSQLDLYKRLYIEYEHHLSSLPRYAYPIKLENGTELVEGKDFELKVTGNIINNAYPGDMTIDLTAVPLVSVLQSKEAILDKVVGSAYFTAEPNVKLVLYYDAIKAMEEYKSLSDSRVKELEGEVAKWKALFFNKTTP